MGFVVVKMETPKIMVIDEKTRECITSEEWGVNYYLCDCGNHKIRMDHRFCFVCGSMLDWSRVKK